MSRFQLDIGTATDVGRFRSHNEDRYATWVPRPDEDPDIVAMLLVADGMGGERGGAHASQLTAERFIDWLTNGIYRAWPEYEKPCELGEVLRRAVRDISDELFLTGEREPSLQGLGSTVVLTIACGERITIAHVGDSRCYRVRDSKIRCLTTDHTWVEEQVAAGVISPEDAQRHPQRNVLTRSLGDSQTPEADIRTEQMQDQDLFVLCSDGLTGKITDDMILAASQAHPDPQDLARYLCDLAVEEDGSDNVTVVTARCLERPDSRREPDDTQPMDRPDLSGLTTSHGSSTDVRRAGMPLGLVILGSMILTLLGGYAGVRFYAGQRYERSMEFLRDGRYLEARAEIQGILELGMTTTQANDLLDLLFDVTRQEQTGLPQTVPEAPSTVDDATEESTGELTEPPLPATTTPDDDGVSEDSATAVAKPINP